MVAKLIDELKLASQDLSSLITKQWLEGNHASIVKIIWTKIFQETAPLSILNRCSGLTWKVNMVSLP